MFVTVEMILPEFTLTVRGVRKRKENVGMSRRLYICMGLMCDIT